MLLMCAANPPPRFGGPENMCRTRIGSGNGLRVRSSGGVRGELGALARPPLATAGLAWVASRAFSVVHINYNWGGGGAELVDVADVPVVARATGAPSTLVKESASWPCPASGAGNGQDQPEPLAPLRLPLPIPLTASVLASALILAWSTRARRGRWRDTSRTGGQACTSLCCSRGPNVVLPNDGGAAAAWLRVRQLGRRGALRRRAVCGEGVHVDHVREPPGSRQGEDGKLFDLAAPERVFVFCELAVYPIPWVLRVDKVATIALDGRVVLVLAPSP